VFTSRHEHYRADTCRPVVEAQRAGAIGLWAVAHGAYPGVRLADEVLPELRSAGAWDVPAKQDWGLDWHRNEGIEFTCILSGRLGFAVDDQSFALCPGHLTITRPWQRHRVGLPGVEASKMVWIILDVGVRRPNQPWIWPEWLILTREERGRLTLLLSHNEQPVWKVEPELQRDFHKISLLARKTSRPFDRTRMALAINETLLAILELLTQRNVPLDETLTSSLRTVELFLAELPRHLDEEWSLDSMADHCGLKRSRFTSLCWQLTNRSPAHYLTQCRVEAAQRLLCRQPCLSITEVAFASGFCSSQHFANVFRNTTGQTPTWYRMKTSARCSDKS
jgi:AraC-like DNA-binding protein